MAPRARRLERGPALAAGATRHHLALAARVPVGLGFLDYGRRIAGVTNWLSLSGDQGQDLARIRAFYADKSGLHPALAGEIRLRDDI